MNDEYLNVSYVKLTYNILNTYNMKGIESLPQTLDFLTPKSLQPNFGDLCYFKQCVYIELLR